MLLYKLNEMFSLIHVILFLTFIFSSFLLYDKTAWRYVIFCPFSLADITEETDVMLFQKIKRARSPKRCSTSSKAQRGAPHMSTWKTKVGWWALVFVIQSVRFWDAPCLQKIKSFPPNLIRHGSRGYETHSQAYIKMPSSLSDEPLWTDEHWLLND